jgi:DNA-binding XRE family transcriptional regulator
MSRKAELEKMTVLGGLSDLARQYNLDIDHLRKSEIIEAILKAEGSATTPEKKTRGPRDKASTKLKALRVSSGLTQLEVATRSGLNFRTYQYYEQGSKPIEGAKLETLIKICLVLNCKLDQIIEDTELVNLITEYEK